MCCVGLLGPVWCAIEVLCGAACSDLVRRVAGAAADRAESMGRGDVSQQNVPRAREQMGSGVARLLSWTPVVGCGTPEGNFR